MKEAEIIALMESGEPLAIIRYFQWTSFSKSHAQPSYVMLRLDHGNRDIDEIDIPRETVSKIMDRLDGFERRHRTCDGTVWERHSFGEKARKLVPRAKLSILISKKV